MAMVNESRMNNMLFTNIYMPNKRDYVIFYS